MIGLGPAGEHVAQMARDGPVVPLHQAPAPPRIDGEGEDVGGEPDLGVAVPVQVGGLAERVGPGVARRGVGQGLGGDEVAERGAADVREVHAPEDAVPVRAVAFAGPEFLERLCLLRPRRHRVDLRARAQGQPVERVDFGVLHEEMPPEPAADERERLREAAAFEIVLEAREARGGLGRERPLGHLLVGGRRQIDPPGGAVGPPVLARGGDLDPRGGFEGLEEAIDPPAGPAVLVGARPEAELLSVVPHQREIEHVLAAIGAHVALRERPQIGEHFLHRPPGNQVAQPLQARKDRERHPRLLGEVVAEQLRLGEPHGMEMGVVHDRVPDARFAERTGQVRFPDAFGEPEALRGDAEFRGDRVGQLLDLAALVGIGEDREDRLVVAAGQHLDLPAGDERANPLEEVGPVGFQPVEQRSGVVERQADAGMAFQGGEQGRVRPVRRLGDDVVEVPDGLVVVDGERQDEGVHRGQPAPPSPAPSPPPPPAIPSAGASSSTLPPGM